jgi:hypothetical protein
MLQRHSPGSSLESQSHKVSSQSYDSPLPVVSGKHVCVLSRQATQQPRRSRSLRRGSRLRRRGRRRRPRLNRRSRRRRRVRPRRLRPRRLQLRRRCRHRGHRRWCTESTKAVATYCEPPVLISRVLGNHLSRSHGQVRHGRLTGVGSLWSDLSRHSRLDVLTGGFLIDALSRLYEQLYTGTDGEAGQDHTRLGP